LSVVDISDPTDPKVAGYYETNGYGMGVTVDGNYVYLGDEWDGLYIIEFDESTSIEDAAHSNAIPGQFELEQNYPNPFNPTTAISYQLPAVSQVDLSIYNSLGQKVATLVSERQAAGVYQVEWDARGFASGIYLFRLEAGSFVQTRKLLLLQ